MSNKTPTPIQQAIYNIEYKLAYSTTSNDERMALNGTLIMLKKLLPAERKFAEECFDAGYNYADTGFTDNTYSDFITFYKNNYEDGK